MQLDHPSLNIYYYVKESQLNIHKKKKKLQIIF